MPLTSLSIRNFRAFSRETRFELAPITLLVGPNNSGKSSVTRALELLQESATNENLRRLAFDSPRIPLGSFERAFNRASGEDGIALGIGFSLPSGGGDCHVQHEWGPSDLQCVSWEYKGTRVATLERVRREEVDPGLRLSISKSLFSIHENDQNGEAWNSGVDAKDWSSLTAQDVEVEWDAQALNVSDSVADLFSAVTVDGEASERRLSSWLSEAASEVVTRKALPMLLKQWQVALQTVGVGAVEMIGAEDAHAQRLYIDGDQSQMARLLRRFYRAARSAEALVRSWFAADGFGIGTSLKVERVSDVGYSAFVQRDEWDANKVSPLPTLDPELSRLLGEHLPADEKGAHVLSLDADQQKRRSELLAAYDVACVPNQVARERLPPNGRMNLADMGYGFTRLMPLILINALPSRQETLTVLEEPEAHLHPRLQSRLADLFVSMTQRGQQLLVETHSEYLVRRLQYLVARGDLPPDAVRIYYLTGEPTAEDHVSAITLDADGLLSEPFGPGFFDEASMLMAEHFRFQGRN